MQKIIIFFVFFVSGLSGLLAQQIQFIQANLGACDSTKLLELSAKLLPDTLKWDSLSWTVNGVKSMGKNQIIKVKLGDSLKISYFYGSPVLIVVDSFIVRASRNFTFSRQITGGDRYTNGSCTISVVEPGLFSVSSWNVNFGSIASSGTGSAVINGTGNIRVNVIYNSGCLATTSVFIPMETKPEPIILQTVLADPIGLPGLLSGKLSDGSIIDSLNGSLLNSSNFSLPVSSGLNTIRLSSGSFVWEKQVKVESLAYPNYELKQIKSARWCDSTDAEIQITTDRGLIDSVSNGTIYSFLNDTAIVTTTFGDQSFTIYNGLAVTKIHKSVQKEESWSGDVFFTEIKPPTCSQSNDGMALISFPANVVSMLVDAAPYSVQYSITNLSADTHLIELIDSRACSVLKNLLIPNSTKACFRFSDAFSPNGDGINDVWTSKVPAGTSIEIEVYTYCDLRMNRLSRRRIFIGTGLWDGMNNLSGTIAKPAYYLVVGTISYPAYMNMPDRQIREIIKLVR